MTLLPAGLRGRLMVAIALALIVAQVIAFALFARERSHAVRLAYRENVVVRTEGLLHLLDETPVEQRATILATASTRALRFSVDADPAVEDADTDRRTGSMVADFAGRLELPVERVRIALVDRDAALFDWPMAHRRDHMDNDRDSRRPHRRPRWIAFSIARDDGSWLNAVAGSPPQAPPFGGAFLVSLLLSLIAVLAASYWMARGLTNPILALARSAHAFGVGGTADPVPASGPREVRETIAAFNDMQARIDRFIKDRTHLLAAVSHDLRTPLTSLRLRAEMIEDEETRTRLIDSIVEMQKITEDTLEFVRAERVSEDWRDCDLQALAQSVADDLAELGHDIAVDDGPRLVTHCQPVALRRALRNLMVNAVTHGGRTGVRLERGADVLHIVIEDAGPGLPTGDLERMFVPFMRGESSRSRDTGGVGMGLPIARTIVRRLGGDVVLENRQAGGLRAILSLPARRGAH